MGHQAVQLWVVHGFLDLNSGVLDRPLYPDSERGGYLHRHCSIYETDIIFDMADDVLTELEEDFLLKNAGRIELFSLSQFGGTVSVADRQMFEVIARKKGYNSPVCWTCGGDIKAVGNILKQ